MLGSFRLLLAIAVALSHAGVAIAGKNPGVIAVVCFYMISGYVMTGLLRGHYASLAKVPHFYVDRLLRLMPQYLLIAALTLAFYFWAKPASYFLGHAPGVTDLFNNLTVVPLNYYMFNGSDTFTLIPPTWSLGAEIQYYLLMPFLLLLRLRMAAFLLALAVYGAAAWGLINSELYGYRLLPGVLVFFMLGSFIFDARAGRGAAIIATASVAGAALFALLLAQFGHLGLPYNSETLLGVCIAAPLLLLLGRLKSTPLDQRFGDWSYGVFLNHFLIQWTITGVPTSMGGWLVYVGSSILLSAATQALVERPVLALRRGLRKADRAAPQSSSESPTR